jgi:tetratricopeptide (TPR) repeat protein
MQTPLGSLASLLQRTATLTSQERQLLNDLLHNPWCVPDPSMVEQRKLADAWLTQAANLATPDLASTTVNPCSNLAFLHPFSESQRKLFPTELTHLPCQLAWVQSSKEPVRFGTPTLPGYQQAYEQVVDCLRYDHQLFHPGSHLLTIRKHWDIQTLFASEQPDPGLFLGSKTVWVLSWLAELLDLPMAEPTLVLGTVDVYGQLAEPLLPADIWPWLSDTLLGTRKLLVVRTAAGGQPSMAEQALSYFTDNPRPGLSVYPIANLAEAMQALWPTDQWLAQVQKKFSTIEHRSQQSSTVFRLALDRVPTLLDWPGVARYAKSALSYSDRTEDERWELHLARDIARRHDGDPVRLPLPPNDWWQRYSRATRLKLLAHMVQSLADSYEYEDDAAPYLERIQAEQAPPGMESSDDLWVSGALGRLWAGRGQWEQAITLLEQTLRGWQALGCEQESSYALCEYLRVVGILNQRAMLEQAISTWVQGYLQTASSTHPGQAYVALAVGRAWVQCGDEKQALFWLTTCSSWRYSPPHVQSSRLRWLRKAWIMATQPEQAQQSLTELEQLGISDQRCLAYIEQAWENDQPWLPHATALMHVPHDGLEAKKTLERLAARQARHMGPPPPLSAMLGSRELIEQLAKEYRYLGTFRNAMTKQRKSKFHRESPR